MNNDYWRKYLNQRKRDEELHSEQEEAVEEVHEDVVEDVVEEVLEQPPVKENAPVEGQVKNNGLTIFRNGKWVPRFP